MSESATLEVSPHYGWLVLQYVAGPDYAQRNGNVVWYDGNGGLWLCAGTEIMRSLVTVELLSPGEPAPDRGEVVYSGRWLSHSETNSQTQITGGEGEPVGMVPFHIPGGPYRAVVQVAGRDESKRIGNAWLDSPDDFPDGEPEPVEHWWVSLTNT
jgi:hypothetical protein